MQIVKDIDSLRTQIKAWQREGLTIGFVPTMGNLHQGHLKLVDNAKNRADKVVSSIFVNPMQFGANEDIDNYPRTMEADQEKLIDYGCDLLFTPTPDVVYPKGLDKQSFVEVLDVADGHCGESRPGHFRGVATVVCKLFNLVQPDFACFGLKDYQQVQVIQTMVEDLNMPIEIVPVATVREESGLALSSRNGYLTLEEKAIAPTLYQSMQWLAERIKEGETADIETLAAKASTKIDSVGMRTDYINVVHARTLQPVSDEDTELVILAAAHCGKARLIDNLQFSR